MICCKPSRSGLTQSNEKQTPSIYSKTFRFDFRPFIFYYLFLVKRRLQKSKENHDWYGGVWVLVSIHLIRSRHWTRFLAICTRSEWIEQIHSNTRYAIPKKKWWKLWVVGLKRKTHRMHLASCLGCLEQTMLNARDFLLFALLRQNEKFAEKIIWHECVYTFLAFVRERPLGLSTWIDCLTSTNAHTHTTRRYQLSSKYLTNSLH